MTLNLDIGDRVQDGTIITYLLAIRSTQFANRDDIVAETYTAFDAESGYRLQAERWRHNNLRVRNSQFAAHNLQNMMMTETYIAFDLIFQSWRCCL